MRFNPLINPILTPGQARTVVTFKPIKGNKLDGLGPEMTVKLASDQKPKAIDLIRDKDGRPWLGVYSLDGDELKLCMAMVEKGNVDEQKRPTDFDKTKVQMIIIAKRRDGFSGCVKMSTFSPL